jgi:hypothetical protein
MNLLSIKACKVILGARSILALVKLLAIMTLEEVNFEVERSLFLLNHLGKESWIVLIVKPIV